MTGQIIGPMGVASLPPIYTGPGDVVASAWSAWWGLRAFSLATAGNNVLDIIRASDSTTQTFNTLSNGNLDVSSITTFLASTTGKVSKLYDQTGNGHDLTQATGANQPAFTFNAIGSLPGITFDGSTSFMPSASSVTVTQPYTLSTVVDRTISGGPRVILRCSAGIQAFIGYDPAPCINSGVADLSGTDSIGSFHSLVGVFNNTTSTMSVDGTQTNGTISSSNDFTGNFWLGAGSITPTFVLQGIITEAGLCTVGFSSGQMTSMSNNQRTYWGF